VRWDLELGLETYFTSPSTRFYSGNVDTEVLEKTYGAYRAADDTHDEDIIDASGIERLCADIGIDPVDPVILNISMKMGAKTMGAYTKDEFFRGMSAMECDTVASLKEKVPALRKEMDDVAIFKNVFEYSFDFAKEEIHKSLPLETAAAMFRVLLNEKWPLVDEWCGFLERANVKTVTRDTWNQILEFSKQISPNMEGYDPAGAWPYLIDEFVEFKMEQKDA
jgi:DCN1-like protein 1/2